METNFGVFQSTFQGTPINTCLPVVGTSSACQWAAGRSNEVIFTRTPGDYHPLPQSSTQPLPQCLTCGDFVASKIIQGARTPTYQFNRHISGLLHVAIYTDNQAQRDSLGCIQPLPRLRTTYAELLTHKYEEAIAHARKPPTVPHSGLAGVHFVAALALEATQQPVEALEEYHLYLQEDPDGRDVARAQKAIERLSESAPK
jgi:hypothetical protein